MHPVCARSSPPCGTPRAPRPGTPLCPSLPLVPCTQLCIMPEPALERGSWCLSLILSGIPKSFFSTFPPGTRWAHILVSSLRCSFGPADLSEQYSYSSQSNAVSQSQSRCWDPQPSPAQTLSSGKLWGLYRPLAAPLPCMGCKWQPQSPATMRVGAAPAVPTSRHPASVVDVAQYSSSSKTQERTGSSSVTFSMQGA